MLPDRRGGAMRTAITIAVAIVGLDACSGGFGGCSGSRGGCGGCRRGGRGDENTNGRVFDEPVSSPPMRAVAPGLTTAAGSERPSLQPAEPPPASTAPLPQPASGVALEIHPAPVLGHPSQAFRVRVGGQPAYVERHGGVSYVRFAFEGTVDVDIEVDAAIATHRVLPATAVRASTQRGNTLRLSLFEPVSASVRIDGLEKLLVIADPIESEPAAGTDGVFSVADFGAAAKAPGLATAAIQSAIDAASTRPGGGTVLFPPGRYVTGSLRVKSDVTLYLAAGALVEGSPDPGDYPLASLVFVDQASRVRIRGRGTIDGQGSFVRQQHKAVPDLVGVRESESVTIEDVLLRDPAGLPVHALASKDVLVRNVRVLNDRPDTSTDDESGLE